MAFPLAVGVPGLSNPSSHGRAYHIGSKIPPAVRTWSQLAPSLLQDLLPIPLDESAFSERSQLVFWWNELDPIGKFCCLPHTRVHSKRQRVLFNAKNQNSKFILECFSNYLIIETFTLVSITNFLNYWTQSHKIHHPYSLNPHFIIKIIFLTNTKSIQTISKHQKGD